MAIERHQRRLRTRGQHPIVDLEHEQRAGQHQQVDECAEHPDRHEQAAALAKRRANLLAAVDSAGHGGPPLVNAIRSRRRGVPQQCRRRASERLLRHGELVGSGLLSSTSSSMIATATAFSVSSGAKVRRTGGCRLYLIHSHPVRADMPIHTFLLSNVWVLHVAVQRAARSEAIASMGPRTGPTGWGRRCSISGSDRGALVPADSPARKAGTQPSPDVTGENRQSDPDRGWVRAAATARHFGFGRSPPAHMRQRVPSGRASSDEAYRGPASPTRLPPHQERNRALRLLHPGVVHP